MEKENRLDRLFTYVKVSDLLDLAIDGVRHAACQVPEFRNTGNGCIRITMTPLHPAAAVWMGQRPTIYDARTQEWVSKIRPGGSYVIDWKDPEDGHTEPVNCFGYSAIKTAWAMYKLEHPEDNPCPRDLQDLFCEENGWSTHEGSVGTIIRLNGERFVELYICTSGAKSEEDLKFSIVGMKTVRDHLVPLLSFDSSETPAIQVEFTPALPADGAPYAHH